MNYIFQFFLWGFLIAWFSFVANNLWPKAAALFYALPIQFTIHVVLLYLQTYDKQEIFVVSKSSIYSLLMIIFFLIMYSFLLSKYSFLISTIIAYLFFWILVWIYIYYFM